MNLKQKITKSKKKTARDDKYTEYKSNAHRKLSIEQYLDNIRSYLGDMIDDIRTFGECLIHLTMKMNFMLSKGKNEKRLMHSKSDNKEIMIGSDANQFFPITSP